MPQKTLNPETIAVCNYCGEAFGPDVTPSQEKALQRHEWECDQHPLKKIKADLLALCRLIQTGYAKYDLAILSKENAVLATASTLMRRYTVGLNHLYPHDLGEDDETLLDPDMFDRAVMDARFKRCNGCRVKQNHRRRRKAERY